MSDGPPDNILVDGRPLPARPGQTVAAVLLAAGYDSGLYCGIGVCMACVVEAEGLGIVPGCQLPARPGLSVRTGLRLPNASE